MTKKALKLALEALESKYIVNCGAWRVQQDQAITAIKEALAQLEQKSVAMADYMALMEKYVSLKAAQPEQEPFMAPYEFKQYGYYKDEKGILKLGNIQATQPPQRTWVGLTDEELADCMDMSIQKTCRAVEAKLKEKNNG
jgi:hypothetical protein